MATASPSTRKTAGKAGLDIDELGKRLGRDHIAREDVERAAKGDGAAQVPPDHARFWQVDHDLYGPVEEAPLDRHARATAANLGAANAMIPQVTHHDRADMRAVERLRASEVTGRSVRLTALAFHVKALARCLIEFPRFNASISSEGTRLILKRYVHVGIAVDTPHGLVVPVLRDADRLGLWDIAAGIAGLASRAQRRKLGSDEMGGASMTISNLGGLGGCAFTPIVNPPEVAILGLARSETVPVWEGAAWTPVRMAPLDLSYDHRVINGADAARFLTRHAALLAEPRLMVLPVPDAV